MEAVEVCGHGSVSNESFMLELNRRFLCPFDLVELGFIRSAIQRF